MYLTVIRTANGNIYGANESVFRIEAAPSGGYRLTKFTVPGTAVASDAAPADAGAGDELGYIGKSGRFVAITEPAV